jgi:hypothetical protein
MTVVKMTSFKISQLQRLFHLFGLRKFVNAHNETDLLIGTGCWKNGRECCYCIHPKELFLFLLTKCKTDMTTDHVIDMFFGGDYTRWKHGYCWLLRYLDLRFCNIDRRVGSLHFFPKFGKFKNAIEEYCQKERMYHDRQGNVTFIPGLTELLYNIFGFIDDLIDQVCVPFLGPDGDYEGAPHTMQYINAQETVYSGWKKLHGIKVETVFLPNGIGTVFGPVSARQNDPGTLALSGFDRFITLI